MRRYWKRSPSGPGARAWRKDRATFRFTLHSLIALPILALLCSISVSHAQIVVTDLAGRRVELAAPAKRIILEMTREYSALSMLDRNAANRIVGIGGDSSRILAEEEGDLAAKPALGWISMSTFSIEKALSLKPDLLITTLSRTEQSAAVEAALAKAGVSVVYVDFAKDAPRNTIPSIKLLGKVLGEEKRASEVIDFYRKHIERVVERLEAAKPFRPTILINPRRPGAPCCLAWRPNINVTAFFGDLGAKNITEGLVGDLAQLSLEYLIEKDPEILVTLSFPGSHSLFSQPPTLLQGKSSLVALAAQPGLREIAAIRSGRVHAIDLTLLVPPLNIVAFELFAKWSYPELFADLDPQATLDEINARFLATPRKGPFWASLDPDADLPAGRRP